MCFSLFNIKELRYQPNIIKDIYRYLYRRINKEIARKQHLIINKLIFRRFLVKSTNITNVNESCIFNIIQIINPIGCNAKNHKYNCEGCVGIQDSSSYIVYPSNKTNNVWNNTEGYYYEGLREDKTELCGYYEDGGHRRDLCITVYENRWYYKSTEKFCSCWDLRANEYPEIINCCRCGSLNNNNSVYGNKSTLKLEKNRLNIGLTTLGYPCCTPTFIGEVIM